MLKNLSAAFSSAGFETAPYEVVSSHEDYEERQYPARRWVSIAVEGSDHESAVRKGFRPLFNYITGQNDTETKIEMTTPVTVRLEGDDSRRRFVISFFVPSEFQENPPKPKHPQVFIEDRPALHLFVRRFGGFANNKIWAEECNRLKQILTEKIDVYNFEDYTAGYDAPFKIFNRRNEVWLAERAE